MIICKHQLLFSGPLVAQWLYYYKIDKLIRYYKSYAIVQKILNNTDKWITI